MLAGREGARGYHVPGFGALFVLPPRALPSASPRSLAERAAARSLDDAIRHLQQGLRTASSAEIRTQMEKNLRALRQTRAELRGTARDRSSGVVVLSPPPVPAVPTAPAAPEAPEPDAPSAPFPPMLAPAPWQMWFSIEEPADGRNGETVIRDVRAAVTALLEKQGPSLHQVRPDEYVAVVVDF